MSKKISFEDFLRKSREIHGVRYDYSKVEYVNTLTKVCIVCPEHGEFWQTPKGHMLGYGCPKCAIANRGRNNSGSLDEFIRKARLKFGYKYDYSKAEYKRCDVPVCIICPKHGEFWETPTKHLSNNGCPKCTMESVSKSRRDTLDDFIRKSRLKYGGVYDYSKTEYINSVTPVCITCAKHGDFTVTPHNHLHCGCGCPKCAEESKEGMKKPGKEDVRLSKQSRFIEQAIKVHGGKYDYSRVEYKNSHTNVCIVCPEHGEFWQTPNNHLHCHGCKKCSSQVNSVKNALTTEKFIENARKIHGDKYDYSKVEYTNSRTKVCITCPKHGDFWQMPAMHVNERQGCPLCGTLSSKEELDILEFLHEIIPETKIILREHDMISPKEIDIYIPSLKIGIEYNGLRWHSDLFDANPMKHFTKTKMCNENGICLIQIFEDEWVHKKEIVKDKLRHLLNCNTIKIYARKCTVKEIGFKTASVFLEENHIQGGTSSTVYLGSFYGDKLVGVMTFKKMLKKSNDWELTRFATLINHSVVGLGSKMLHYFIGKFNPSKIQSFADKRWTNGISENIYTKIGFVIDGYTPPSYTYVSSKSSFHHRYHKFGFRKKILHRKYGLPLTMTEKEMTESLNYYRIWDCGLIKYVWKK